MFLSFRGCLCFLAVVFFAVHPAHNKSIDGRPLVTSLHDDDIRNNVEFETVKVSDITHGRRKRDTSSNDSRDVHVRGLGKSFHLILSQNYNSLSPQFKVYIEDGNKNRRRFTNFNSREFYSGHVEGHSSSAVSAHIDATSGLMTASIKVDKDVYTVEPMSHINSSASKDEMILYKLNHRDLLFPNQPLCDSISLNETDATILADQSFNNVNEDHPRREKRQEFGFPSRCPLHLITDYRFFREHGSDVKKTSNFLVSLIDRINMIYLDTEWADVAAGEPSLKGFGFVVQEILVHNEPTRETGHYNSQVSSWAIRDLLDAFSKEKSHKWYCLAHLFTHQQFQSGVLGLAFVAHVKKFIPGGVCTQPVTKNNQQFYYNTGVTTTMNSFGNPIFTRITDLITAHEFGHNWGAEHDPDLNECSPRPSAGGPYIMNTYSLAGYEANNKLFSPCSKSAIANVLNSKSFSCFVSHRKSFCGNGVVDPDEECDAGLLGGEDSDPCCTVECKLKSHATCSDVNHLCCDKCQVKQSGSVCRDSNELDCKETTYCDGISKDCPKMSPPLSDGSPCLDSGTCRGGRCLTFCEVKGLLPCMCDTKTDTCLRCCREAKDNSTCERYMGDGRAIILKDGTLCSWGYCGQGFCRRTTQDTISRLWDVIEGSTMNSFLRFLLNNFVVVVIILVGICYIPISVYIKHEDDQQKELRGRKSHPRNTNGHNGHGMTTRSRAQNIDGCRHENTPINGRNGGHGLPEDPPAYDELDHDHVQKKVTKKVPLESEI